MNEGKKGSRSLVGCCLGRMQRNLQAPTVQRLQRGPGYRDNACGGGQCRAEVQGHGMRRNVAIAKLRSI
jgi:hypothetical protein